MRSIYVFGLAIACLVSTQSHLQAATNAPLIPRADLFGNPVKIDSNISPNGKWISWLAPVDGVMNIWVAPRDSMDTAQPVTQDRGRGISFSIWAFDGHHLLYTQDRNGNANLHVYAVDITSRTTKDLTSFAGARATIVALSAKRPNEILISLNKRDPKYADIYRANLNTGALTLIYENPGFTSFLADDQLNLRLAVKIEPTNVETVMRWSDGTWKPWTTIPTEDLRTTRLLALDSAGKSVFALDSRGRDTLALVRIDLATGNKTIIAEDPHSDIGDVLFDLKTHEPLMYSVNVARVQHIPLTPAAKRDIDFLDTQKLGDWSINSRSSDNRYWKLTATTDLRLAAVLYDRKTHKVTQLYDPHPSLDGAVLAHMYPVTIKARDGLNLVGYLSLPHANDTSKTDVPDHPLPLVLLVHGGPHNRDSYGFNPIHQWLANRGYAALSVNMRGSTGYGKAFLNASAGEWGTKLDDDLVDSVHWAILNKIADPAHVATMGGSYGGFAVLRGLTREPDTYACGVDLYGPSDLLTMQGPTTTYGVSALNHNEVGDPTTPEGRARMKDQSPLYQADRIKSPLLVAQGANDPAVIPALQSDKMVAAVKAVGVPVTYLLYPDEGHGFVRAANNLSFYAVAEQFLAKCLGGRSESIDSNSLAGSSIQVLEGAEQIPGLEAALEIRGKAASTSSAKPVR